MTVNNYFYDGQMLKAIYPGDMPSHRVGEVGCKSIIVVMESGQMDLVPWAIAVGEDGTRVKYNLALCESVEI